jgi:hypothetical protein
MFGTTEEVSSGILCPYWEKDNAIAQKTTFNPINLVENGTRQSYYPRRKRF